MEAVGVVGVGSFRGAAEPLPGVLAELLLLLALPLPLPPLERLRSL